MPDASWMSRFTLAHPELRMDVLDRLELGRGTTLLEVRISAPEEPEGGGWSEEIRRLPSVRDVELLGTTGNSETCRVIFRGTTFIPILRRLRLVRHFPFPIQNGLATWNVVGPEGKVRQLLDTLGKLTDRVQVLGVRHGSSSGEPGLLSPRQEEVLRRALAEGYFDVPRRISLTGLAAKMGVAISTLSVTLAVIEKKILEPRA
jgi:predicted DNA binding protein